MKNQFLFSLLVSMITIVTAASSTVSAATIVSAPISAQTALSKGAVSQSSMDTQIVDSLTKNSGSTMRFSQVQSCDALETVLAKYAKAYTSPYPMPVYDLAATSSIARDAASPSAEGAGMKGTTASDSLSSSIDFSQTNTQKTGVDEPDTLKTDGTFLYYYNTASNSVLILSSPLSRQSSTINLENAKVIKEIALPQNISNVQLFIAPHRLAIIGTSYMTTSKISTSFFSPAERTLIAIYDTSSLPTLSLLKLENVQGYFSDARLIDNLLYVITSLYPQWRYRDTNSITAKSLSETPLINSATAGTNGNGVDNLPCDSITYVLPQENSSTNRGTAGFTIVNAIDLKDTAVKTQKTALLGNLASMHMSQNSLYLMSTIYTPNDWSCPAGMACIMPRFYGGSQTLVHKFKRDNLTFSYQGTAVIPGDPLTQYSMDENTNGYFRILTQQRNNGQKTSLYILDSQLSLKGKLENISPGEQFKSSRYIGNKLYLVTFKQIDPLFVVDTSDATHPKMLGSLHIPGYSTYLHPLKDVGTKQYLAGIGYDVGTGQRGGQVNSGVKVSLYEIDYNKKTLDGISVKELATTSYGGEGSYSEVLSNPRLFTINSKGQLLLPLLLSESKKTGEYCTISYNENGNEQEKTCYPKTENTPYFVGIKELLLSETRGIQEVFSKNYLTILQPTLNIGAYDLLGNGKVGFAGDSFYFLTNYFGDFFFGANSKRLSFSQPQGNGYPKLVSPDSSTLQKAITTTETLLQQTQTTGSIPALTEEKLQFFNTVIAILHEKGITKYTSYSDFLPTQNIRRDEAAKMFTTAITSGGLSSQAVFSGGTTCSFSDSTLAHHDLVTFLSLACEKGLFKGSKGTFSPNNNITYGELFTVAGRILFGAQDETHGHFAQQYYNLLSDNSYLMNLEDKGITVWEMPATRMDIGVLLYTMLGNHSKE